MLGPFARIALRYAAGVLVAKGLLDPQTGAAVASDPDVISLVMTGAGFVMALVTEGFYWAARRLGWST